VAGLDVLHGSEVCSIGESTIRLTVRWRMPNEGSGPNPKGKSLLVLVLYGLAQVLTERTSSHI